MQHLLSLLEESLYGGSNGRLTWCGTWLQAVVLCELTCTDGHTGAGVLEEKWMSSDPAVPVVSSGSGSL